MSQSYQLYNSEQANKESSDWIVKIDRGLNEEENGSFRHWLLFEPRNRTVFTEMATLWDHMESLSLLAEVYPKHASNKDGPRIAYNHTAMAMICVVVLVSMVELINHSISPTPSKHTFDEQYQTAIGEQLSLRLPDGNNLFLNTNSHIKVHYSPQQKVLTLLRGEIHIQAAEYKDNALSVIAGQKRFQSTATTFNLQILNNDSVELLVSEGKVLVTSNESDNAQHLAQNYPTVKQGEKALFSKEDTSIYKMDDRELIDGLSWRTGQLVFREEHLESALAEINRYTPVQFQIIGEDLRALPIAGEFQVDDLDDILLMLKAKFNISHQQEGNTITLARN